MFYAVKNLSSQDVEPCAEPWNYKFKNPVSRQVRHVKADRQIWATDPNTDHNFYSGVEALNPNLRVSKDNPAHSLSTLVFDYDVVIPDARLEEAIAAMKIKPTWIETSLGGNRRLLWVLEIPVLVDGNEFCEAFLKGCRKWLALDTLPGLDEPAMTPTRMWANGGEWKATGHGPIPKLVVQAYLVKLCKEFSWKPKDGSLNIPLDVVEEELKKRYPNFSWPSDFTENSQGPSFWIPESQSPMSAIVRKGGMSTYSAHASKRFYSWAELLGSEFVSQFIDNSIAKATADTWCEGKSFWKIKRKDEGYVALGEREMINYFRTVCRLSNKSVDDEPSQIEQAFSHIYNHQSVAGVACWAMQRGGPMMFDGERVLNLYRRKPIQPAAEPQKWGPQGNFPFLSLFFEWHYDRDKAREQQLAEWQIFYQDALDFKPSPGNNSVWVGVGSSGKSLISRYLVGDSVGGFVDVADYLVKGGTFNSYCMEYAYWAIDDDSPGSGTYHDQAKTQAAFKKVAANQSFAFAKKFHDTKMVDWAGRLGITLNMTLASTRILTMDSEGLRRTNLYQSPTKEYMAAHPFQFPSRREMEIIIARELPYFLRWLLDMKRAEWIQANSRYSIEPFHDERILELLQDHSQSAAFCHALTEALVSFFMTNPTKDRWTGTCQQLLMLLQVTPGAEYVLRGSNRLQSLAYDLERIKEHRLLPCEESKNQHGIPLWTFFRMTSVPVPEKQATPENSAKFEKA